MIRRFLLFWTTTPGLLVLVLTSTLLCVHAFGGWVRS